MAYTKRPLVSKTGSTSNINTQSVGILQDYLNKIEADRAKAVSGVESAFGKEIEDQLRIGRTSAVGGGMQNLVSSGLAGTSVAGGLDTVYGRDVAAPTRLAAESQKAQLLAQLLQPSGAEANIVSQIADMLNNQTTSWTVDSSALNRPFGSSFSSMQPSTAPAQTGPSRSQLALAEQTARNQAATERLSAARSATAAKSAPLTQPNLYASNDDYGGGITVTPGDPARRLANILSNQAMSGNQTGLAGLTAAMQLY